MKYNTLIFLSLYPFLLFGQSKDFYLQSYNLSFSPTFSIPQKEFKGAFNTNEEKRTPQMGFSVGISLDVSLLPNWEMRIGLDYSTAKFKTKSLITNTSSLFNLNSITYRSSNYHIIDCPITFICTPTNKKVYFGSSLGASTVRKLNYNFQVYEQNSRVYNENTTYNYTIDDIYFSPYFKLFLGYNYQLGKQNRFSIEPFINLRKVPRPNHFDGDFFQFSFGISTFLKFQALK